MEGDEMAHNTDNSCHNCPFQEKFFQLEQNTNQIHQKLQQSAVYGKELLEKNGELLDQIKILQSLQEKSNQENHHLKMQLEVAMKFQNSQGQELESMKDALQQMDEVNQQLKSLEEEQHRKELSHESEMTNLKEQEEVKYAEYEEKINALQTELQQLKSTPREPVVMSCEHEEEINQLQLELELSQQSNSQLEGNLVAVQNQLQQLKFTEKQLHGKISEMEAEMLSKEKELASTEKLLEEKRVEMLDLQALLEAERVSQTNPEKRGNSIFSEVEDRRQQVERHLAKLTSLLDKEKRKNQDLQAEAVKLKNQMAFLACGGSNSEPTRSSEQMENLLRSSNAQSKDLLKKIEDLERRVQCQSQPVPQLEDSRKWMQAMLTQKQEENDKLRGEIRDHIRSYLCQTDQTMQLTKRLADTEKNLQRAHAEVFRLKLKIEEMVTGNENLAEGASPIYTVPPTRVVEDLKSFVLKKEDLTANVHPEKALKERVVLQAQLHQNVTIQSSSPPTVVTAAAEEIRTAENINPCMKVLSVDKKSSSTCADPSDQPEATTTTTTKRQVRMNTEVRAVYEDGDSTVETLAEDKFTAGVKKTTEKPVGKQVEVVDVSTAPPAMECNQQ